MLHPSQSTSVAIGIDFRDTTQPANFDVWYDALIACSFSYSTLPFIFFILNFASACARLIKLKLISNDISAFSTQSRKFAVSIKPPVGELMHKNPISQDEFIAEKGRLIPFELITFQFRVIHFVIYKCMPVIACSPIIFIDFE